MLTMNSNTPGPTAAASQGRRQRSNSVFTGVCGTANYPYTIVLLKAGSDGTLQWANRYQLGRGCTVGQDLAATPDGGAAIVASVLPDFANSGNNSGDEESAVLRIDANGGIVWQTGFQPVLSLDSIAARTDGSIVVAGGRWVIFLTPAGSLASFDSFPIFGGGPTAIALFPDGYAFAASDCILNSDGGCGATTPLIVRVGANPWTVHLPVIPDVDQFEVPYALVAAPDGSMIVQSDIGRDARIDPGGAIVWDQLAHPDFFIRGPYYPGAVDAGGVFWRPGSIGGGGLPGSTYLRRIAPDGSSSDLLVGSTDWGAFGVVLAASGQMAFLGEDFVLSGAPQQVIVALDPSDQGCLAQRPPSVPLQPASFSTSGIPATYYVPGNAESPTTIPITAVRNCMAVASADLCALPASRPRWTPVAEQAPGGGCPSTLTFAFELDPATVVATPNPWNTPAIARVLTHKYGANDTYPSTYQIDRQDVTLHPRFKFPGLARNGNGQAVNIWFRVIDPPDTAPYVVQNNDAHDNDNKDTSFSSGKGILMTPTCSDLSAQSTCAALNGNALATTTASDGTVQVVLETTDRFAGDNYQILASFSAPGPDGKFPCEAQNTCAKSAPITAWKRVYLENQRMFQHGAYLAESARTTGDTFIVVDISPFRQGQQVRFVHAPAGPRELPSTQSQYYFDDGVIAPGGVTPFSDGAGGTIKLQSALPTMHPYVGRPPQLSQIRPPVDQGDYVGVVTGDDRNDYWAANNAYVAPLFETAFVDYASASPRVLELPFVKQLQDFALEDDEVDTFAKRWFEGLGLQNYQHLMGVFDTSSCANRGQPSRGVTRAKFGYGSSYVCIPPILGRLGTQSSVRLLGAVTAHEISHQWHVDPRGQYSRAANGSEHDDLLRFNSSSLFCLMHFRYDDDQGNVLPEFQDGLVVFHYKSDVSGVDSEYRWIRERCEPIPYRALPSSADWWTVAAIPCN